MRPQHLQRGVGKLRAVRQTQRLQRREAAREGRHARVGDRPGAAQRQRTQGRAHRGERTQQPIVQRQAQRQLQMSQRGAAREQCQGVAGRDGEGKREVLQVAPARRQRGQHAAPGHFVQGVRQTEPGAAPRFHIAHRRVPGTTHHCQGRQLLGGLLKLEDQAKHVVRQGAHDQGAGECCVLWLCAQCRCIKKCVEFEPCIATIASTALLWIARTKSLGLSLGLPGHGETRVRPQLEQIAHLSALLFLPPVLPVCVCANDAMQNPPRRFVNTEVTTEPLFNFQLSSCSSFKFVESRASGADRPSVQTLSVCQSLSCCSSRRCFACKFKIFSADCLKILNNNSYRYSGLATVFELSSELSFSFFLEFRENSGLLAKFCVQPAGSDSILICQIDWKALRLCESASTLDSDSSCSN